MGNYENNVPFTCVNCGKNGKGRVNQKWCYKKVCLPKKGRRNFKFKCHKCGKEGLGVNNQIYCSVECRTQSYFGEGSQLKHLSSGTVGAISELRVSIDLMVRGYEVFRALSPACSCDVLALKDGVMKRFEVRTGYEMANGKVNAPSNHKADYLVIVTHQRIIYQPEI